MASISPGATLGRYRIVQQLGRGGMATVYRCHDPNLDRYVAVKVLPSFHTEDPTFLGRFTQEAQTIARLNHPNILQVYDFGEDKGFTYIVSELIPGGTLQDKLTGDFMPIEDVLRYIKPLAGALDFAHANGILHRDMKPANVLLSEHNQPILADFGLARMLEASTRFTQPHQALGTPEYISPEQVMGQDSNHRADLYAMGIMLYQMVLGRTPFQADTPAATLLAHVHRELPLPTSIKPDLSPSIEITLLKALAKDPNDRFQSAGEMVQALETAAGATSRAAPSPLGAPAAPGPVTPLPAAAPAKPRKAASIATALTRKGYGLFKRALGWLLTAATTVPPAGARKDYGIFGWALSCLVTLAVIMVPLGASVMMRHSGAEGQPPVPAPVESAAPVASPQAPGARGQAGPGGAPPPDGTSLTATSPNSITETVPVAMPSDGPCVTTAGSSAAADLSRMADALAQLEGMKERAHKTVASLRGIDDPPYVPTVLRTRQQLCVITEGLYRRKEVRDKLFEAEELYKTLGLMADDQSLEEIVLSVQLREVSALLDDRTGEVYVLSDAAKITPEFELSYAMAYMGALQPALFDMTHLTNRTADTGDRSRAVSALISGDVANVAGRYAETLALDQADSNTQSDSVGQSNPSERTPSIVRKANLFPRTEGKRFVEDLFLSNNSWDTVNGAYNNPPSSTEQVLHADKYFANEPPVPVSLKGFPGLMSDGWSLTAMNTMGEFLLRSYLEEHLSEERAGEAAEGWGGDTYILMSNAEWGRLLVALFTFDSVPDATEFNSAFKDFMAEATEGTDTEIRPADTSTMWVTEGGKTVLLGEKAPLSAFLIIGDNFDSVVETDKNLISIMGSPPSGQSQ